MKWGILLLFSVMLLSVLGTFIPQEMAEEFYLEKYNVPVTRLILFFNIDNVYGSIVFGILFAALAVNLILCSFARLGKIINRLKSEPKLEGRKPTNTCSLKEFDDMANSIKNTFNKYGFSTYKQSETQAEKYYSIKNKAGYFGSWLLHLGILVVIISYAFGHVTFFSEAVYGVSGSVQAIQGTEYKAKIQDFNIEYRQDGSIKQYISVIELLDGQERTLKSSPVSVNSPMRYGGYTFYQTSYGWAANCSVMKRGMKIKEDTICEKTTLEVPEENIAISLTGFYPDFAASSKGLTSLTDELKNPVVLYSLLYRGDVVKVDIAPIGEIIKWNDYEFLMSSPQRYTYINVNKMQGRFGAAIGSLLILGGLLLAFYYKPAEMVVKLDEEKIYVYGDQLKAQ